MQPLVSILMNCYNGGDYLSQALESVIAQTYQNWELIFWDNQSTDNSSDIVHSYKDNRIKYFYAETHEALGIARKLALKEVSGDWIGFLDTDDIWLADKLELQMELKSDVNQDDAEIGLVYGRTLLIDEFGNGLGEYLPGDLSVDNLPEGDIFFQLLEKGNFIACPSILFSYRAYESVRGIKDGFYYGPDYYLSVLISKHYGVKLVNQIVCKYRIHSNNESISISSFHQRYIENIELLKTFKNESSKISRRLKWVKLEYFIKKILMFLFGQRKIGAIKKMVTSFRSLN